MKIRLVETLSQGSINVNRLHLGTVIPPAGLGVEGAAAMIINAWPEFQNTRPDSDDQFVSYLINNFGFTEVKDEDTVEITVNP